MELTVPLCVNTTISRVTIMALFHTLGVLVVLFRVVVVHVDLGVLVLLQSKFLFAAAFFGSLEKNANDP